MPRALWFAVTTVQTLDIVAAVTAVQAVGIMTAVTIMQAGSLP